MNFRSLRLRLPLTYAGIALLSALALGGLMLLVLQDYYRQQERDNLLQNARSMGTVMTTILSQKTDDEESQAQVKTMAFLSQTRVRVYDAGGALLADSGELDQMQTAIYPTFSSTVSVAKAYSVQSTEDVVQSGVQVFFFDKDKIQTTEKITTIEASPVISPAGNVLVDGDVTVTLMPVTATMYGFSFEAGRAVPVQRSKESVSQELLAADGTRLGKLSVSGGPAYGTEIVQRVAQVWIFSALAAVLLAALVGWWVSRRLSAPLLVLTETTGRMAQGDLSARADVRSRDEFGELASRFNQMAGQVETTVQVLRRFVSDAAHELHTPLTALRTSLDLAAAEMNPQDVNMARALRQVQRLEALTNDLLDLSRLEAHGQQPAFEAVNLSELAQEVGELYAARAEQQGVPFTLELSASPAWVQGNSHHLRRLLSNLLENALKFTPAGVENAAVGLAVQPMDTGQIEIRVWDHGIGIPAEDQALLFQRFHRGRNAAGIPGSGLGLAMVKAVVDEHGGAIGIESRPGYTLARVTFPSAG